MARLPQSTFLGSVKLFFESPLAMALVAIMATFVTGELFLPLLFGPSPQGAVLASIAQLLALVAMARKLAVCLYWMARQGTEYRPSPVSVRTWGSSKLGHGVK